MTPALLTASVVFLLVFGGLFYGYLYLEEKYWRSVLARRFYGETREAEDMISRLRAPWLRAAQVLGRTAMPAESASVILLRDRLSYAGFRDPEAVAVLYGIRLGLMLLFGTLYLVAALLAGHLRYQDAAMVFLPLAAGYFFPTILLNMRIRSRQAQIFRELPDALDLVLICLEAGLSFDAALFRVSRELANVSPVLAGEFSQYFLEIQSGLPRKTVLTHLAERNGVESLTTVVGVLLQSIRFGTNIADSLRVHIQSMRTQRRQLAEEAGAKMSTRLTFPMVLLILPALFIVILGPAILNVYEKIKGGL
ncbi:type II secretion system F family protein [Desulfobulbus elongatus]|uniref:type II secretion system F family protein n=1 Tax=Desulfobulbus elongatus TaxID=53332 RepID=UPI000686E010|nr:type II secretion system F family protein [Desulfobulbus elongatus]